MNAEAEALLAAWYRLEKHGTVTISAGRRGRRARIEVSGFKAKPIGRRYFPETSDPSELQVAVLALLWASDELVKARQIRFSRTEDGGS